MVSRNCLVPQHEHGLRHAMSRRLYQLVHLRDPPPSSASVPVHKVVQGNIYHSPTHGRAGRAGAGGTCTRRLSGCYTAWLNMRLCSMSWSGTQHVRPQTCCMLCRPVSRTSPAGDWSTT